MSYLTTKDGKLRFGVTNKKVVEKLAKYERLDRDSELIEPPHCDDCKHRNLFYSDEPCYSCSGQSGINEMGFCYEPEGEDRV